MRTGSELGEAKQGEGLLLGALAIAPLTLAAAAVWLAPPQIAAWCRSAAVVWSGALLAFLAGVQRGLTFSEARGASIEEIASSLWVFAWAVSALLLVSSPLGLCAAIVGSASVGLLDARAARRSQAPRYFRVLRPAQMAVAVAALAAILGRILGGYS